MCEARQYSDQMCCGRCGLVWDMNDPEPPDCLTDRQISERKAREAIETMKEVLSDDNDTYRKTKGRRG